MVAVVTLGNSMIANHVLSFMVYSWLIKLFVSQFLVLSTFFACLSDVDLFFSLYCCAILLVLFSPTSEWFKKCTTTSKLIEITNTY